MSNNDTKPLDALDEAVRATLGNDYHEDDAENILAELRDLGFDIVEVGE